MGGPVHSTCAQRGVGVGGLICVSVRHTCDGVMWPVAVTESSVCTVVDELRGFFLVVFNDKVRRTLRAAGDGSVATVTARTARSVARACVA